jgi:metal transporter CNNM
MTKIDDVYMLEINTLLGHKTLREIYSKGFSRVPIYEKTKDNIVGILMSRDLILINPDKQLITLKQMSSIIIKDVIAVGNKDKLEPLLGYFKDGLTHIGIVTKFVDEHGNTNDWKGEPDKKVVGIVTLEDIIEEIISDEINDEYE